MNTYTCAHADTCLSDYWGGHHLPHIQIYVWAGMTLRDIKDALQSEVSQGAFSGSSIDYDNIPYEAFKEAVEAITPSSSHKGDTFFNDVEQEGDGDSVCAFFVFEEN